MVDRKEKNWVTEGQAPGVKKTHGSGSTRNAAKEAVGYVELRDQPFRKKDVCISSWCN
jgi:hypothetical protein